MKSRILLFFLLVLAAFAELRDVTILQTCDTHGELFPTTPGRSSWLKLATVIRRVKDTAGAQNCLLVDCGDTSQGTIIASLTRGKAGMVPINCLEYDAFVPGNHELNFGIPAYQQLTACVGAKLLSANLAVRGQPRPPAWKLFKRNGVTIALIGIAPVYFRHWLMPDEMAQLDNEKGLECLETIMPQVHAAKPDLIVLAAHQGWTSGPDKTGRSELNAIAERYPEIDLILGGHTHVDYPGQVIGHRTWYVQAGDHAQSVAVVKATVDTEKHCLTTISSTLEMPAEDTPDDALLSQALEEYRKLDDEEQKRLVAAPLCVKVSSSGKPGQGCQTSDLICQAIADAVGADVAIHSVLSSMSLNPGRLRGRHLHWLIPYDNRIVTLMVTAKELEEIVGEQWKNRFSYRYNGPWNADFDLVDGTPKLTAIAGAAPVPGKRYKLALNDHAAAGSGDSPVLCSIVASPEAQCQHTAILTRRALEDYFLKQQGNFSFKPEWIHRAK